MHVYPLKTEHISSRQIIDAYCSEGGLTGRVAKKLNIPRSALKERIIKLKIRRVIDAIRWSERDKRIFQ